MDIEDQQIMDHVAQNVKMSNLHNAELKMRLQELRQKIEREEELAEKLEAKVILRQIDLNPI